MRASVSSIDKPLSTALALMLLGFLLSDRLRLIVARGSAGAFYGGAAIVCWVLSWGPFPRLLGSEVLYQAPYAWLLQLPGVDALRVPARFWMMTVLCLAIVAGRAIPVLLGGRSARAGAGFLAAAAVALLLDGWVTIPAAAIPLPVADTGSLRGRTVMLVPAGEAQRDVGGVYQAVAGGWTAINGFSGYEPPYYEALRTLSQAGDPLVFEVFARTRPIHIVDERGSVRELPAQSGQRAAAPEGRRLPARAVGASCSPEGMVYATDARMDTRWVCGVQEADAQIAFDLGSAAPVGTVVHALGPLGADFPRHLVIETSLDGTSWTPAWEGSPAAGVLVAAMEAPRQTRVVLSFTPRPAQYVRLRQTGRHDRNYWSIAELEVWTGA
jgi:hypothetical protein